MFTTTSQVRHICHIRHACRNIRRTAALWVLALFGMHPLFVAGAATPATAAQSAAKPAAAATATTAAPVLTAAQLRQQVERVNAAQNRMMRQGSTPADIAALFALYTDDFSYVHPQYGGTYSRAELERNSLKNQAAGRFRMEQDRYQIRQILTGHNTAAVERLEHGSGQLHLTVFEFHGDKVARIIEYWQ